MSTRMIVQVNGQPREFAAGASVSDLLRELGVTQPHVAVELNLEVVPRAEHQATALRDGDRVEVVTLVGGG
jgi:sulfur carrier protein